MPPANGYAIEINGRTLVASWPAPYFVLDLGWPEEGDEPMLVHCDDLAHAVSRLRCVNGFAKLLDNEFNEITRDGAEARERHAA